MQYDPTVEESYLTTIDIDGHALQVEILDTAGQKEYSPLRETFMHTGDGFLLIYSITDDQTLEELRDIKEQIARVHPNKKVAGCLLRVSAPVHTCALRPPSLSNSPSLTHAPTHSLTDVPQVPMVVVGNKVDRQTERCVSIEEGQALAEEFGASFLEISVSRPVTCDLLPCLPALPSALRSAPSLAITTSYLSSCVVLCICGPLLAWHHCVHMRDTA
jgi:GTPase KRas protein